ncbi:MAG: hypothetical protein Q7T82_05315 [Armatimonadota bacterium]|nr:hypothetical protein [Armatimonadota bacterium]
MFLWRRFWPLGERRARFRRPSPTLWQAAGRTGLVTIYGKFTKTSDATFTLDDGSGLTVKCVVPTGVTTDSGWKYAVVTGISSCEKVGEELQRLLRVRNQGDIVPLL